ncbi:MAG: hypothetical protein WBO82_06615 [Neisseria sp.]
MWHIVAIGYLFVAVMFSIAQSSLARILIYLVFWAVIPALFMFWVAIIRRRNMLLKLAEKQDKKAN